MEGGAEHWMVILVWLCVANSGGVDTHGMLDPHQASSMHHVMAAAGCSTLALLLHYDLLAWRLLLLCCCMIPQASCTGPVPHLLLHLLHAAAGRQVLGHIIPACCQHCLLLLHHGRCQQLLGRRP
jgi:hypothetical protein